jgi:anti-sigma B factor antagonist
VAPEGGERGIRAGLLSIQSQRRGDVHLIALEGELDLANTEALEGALEQALAGGEHAVVIDMAALTFIDSTGIALLIATLGRVEDSDRLRFVPSQAPAVVRVLEVTGVDQRLPFVDGPADVAADPA